MNTIQTPRLALPATAGLWAGRVVAALVALVLLVDGGVNLLAPQLVAGVMKEAGFALELSSTIGSIAVVAVLLFAIPRTSMLGAILITGFLGGAICAHVRLGDFGSPPQVVSLLLGIGAWASLYLRSPALRNLIPLTARGE